MKKRWKRGSNKLSSGKIIISSQGLRKFVPLNEGQQKLAEELTTRGFDVHVTEVAVYIRGERTNSLVDAYLTNDEVKVFGTFEYVELFPFRVRVNRWGAL